MVRILVLGKGDDIRFLPVGDNITKGVLTLLFLCEAIVISRSVSRFRFLRASALLVLCQENDTLKKEGHLEQSTPPS